MTTYSIQPVSTALQAALQHKIDQKTKPLHALGMLEALALRIGLIQQTLSPVLNNPHMLVFAGDHGVVAEGVSAYPQEVTWQMVMNFIGGGAAINVFCRQHGIKLNVVDAGVNYDFPPGLDGLIYTKVGKGTANFTQGPAMTEQQATACIEQGRAVVSAIRDKGCNVIGFGEMGIGNTSAASALMHAFTGIPVGQCVGRGTGLSDSALDHKIAVLQRAAQFHGTPSSPLRTLATYGGFEIAQMAGAMLEAAAGGMIILIDGFIATSAFLAARALAPEVADYAVFCHRSQERGHGQLLQYLGAQPLLDLNLRLGEGTGVAVAYPILQSAVAFLNEMASFESAGVSTSL